MEGETICEREECKAKDAILKKVKDELTVIETYLKLLEKKQREEVDTRKEMLSQMNALHEVLQQHLRSAERDLMELASSICEILQTN
jgi:hypothetical protein